MTKKCCGDHRASLQSSGEATEAYLVRTRGYSGNHHFYWHGLSRRKGVWYLEGALFSESRSLLYHAYSQEIDAKEQAELLAELDKVAAEKGVSREDLNLVKTD